jgi:gliding motility-associated-like protein
MLNHPIKKLLLFACSIIIFVLSSSTARSQNILVRASTQPINSVAGTLSPAITFTVAGKGLLAPVNITTYSTYLIFSLDDVNYFDNLNVGTSGDFAPITVYARVRPDAPLNSGKDYYAVITSISVSKSVAIRVTTTATPIITAVAGPVTGSIKSTTGTPSASPNISQFSVTGNNLTGNINLTAPAGFEISATAAGGYGNAVTLIQTAGVVSKTVFVRSSSSAAVGALYGNITLATAGIPNQNVAVSGVIDPNQTVNNGSATTAVNLAASGCGIYSWVNNQPGIGLAASGTGTIPSFTAINTGSSPVVAHITATPAPLPGSAYIINFMDATVSVADLTTNSVIATIPVAFAPGDAVASYDGSRVYISGGGFGQITVINTLTRSVVGIINAGTEEIYTNDLRFMAINRQGTRLYAALEASNSIQVINTITNSIISNISLNGHTPVGITISPDGGKLYLNMQADNQIWVIDIATETITAKITVGTIGQQTAISPDGTKLYVLDFNSYRLVVINTQTNQISGGVQLNSFPQQVAVSDDGKRIYVTNESGDYVFVIDALTNTITGSAPAGDSPQAVAFSGDGARAYVTNLSTGGLTVINTATNTVTTTIPAIGQYGRMSGNFVSNNHCPPIDFDITVKPGAVTPSITAGAVTGTISACFGSASVSPAIQQFKVSGSGLTANITANAPAGFEVSLTPGSGYANNITLVQAGGVVNNVTVYVRSSATAQAGSYSGQVTLASAGTTANVTVAETINAIPMVNVVSDQTRTDGQATAAITFTGTASTYTWTNSNTGIGLAGTGTGNIPSFTASNPGTVPVTATLYVIPSNASGCTGTPVQFTITVNPTVVTPLITANGTLTQLTTTYGASSANASFHVSGSDLSAPILVTPPQGFEVSIDGTNFSNTVTVPLTGNTASATVFIRLSKLTNAGTYQGNIALTSTGASTVNVAMPTSTVNKAPLTITPPNASKAYGTALADLTAGGLNGATPIGLKNGNTLTSVNIIYGNGSAAQASVGLYAGSVSALVVSGANGFLIGNYDVTYNKADITVTPVALTITVNTVNKTYGQALTGGPGYGAFIATGLKNGDNITSLTIAYGNGAAAGAPVATYAASANGSVPVGNSTFLVSNYTVNYKNGDVVVKPAALTIIADDKTKEAGTANPPLTVTYSGFVNNEGPTQLLTPPVTGTTATTTSPAGEYPITVSGATSGNYTITQTPGTLTITGVAVASLAIPNTFTPNDDGVNDTWNIKNLAYLSKSTVNIYDIRGARVFSSLGYTSPWDGRMNGKNVPTGVYYYVIDTKTDGKLLSGWVTVLK